MNAMPKPTVCDAPVGARRRALITGIAGQDGFYLSELLLSKGYEVHGTVRVRPASGHSEAQAASRAPSSPAPILHPLDLASPAGIVELCEQIEPDEIYNLAAQSHVGDSFSNPLYTASVTGFAALQVLEAARLLNRRTPVRLYQASTSEIFGGRPSQVPQTELTALRPRSPYGCAKAYAHIQTVNYRESYGLFASNGILFNHESPRRSESFVSRKITAAAARISLGLQEKVTLGNLEARRDWGYAKDYVEAMWLMLQAAEPDDYVIATGESHSIRDFAACAFAHLRLDWRDHVHVDSALLRPDDIDVSLGDASKAHARLGWRAGTRFPDLVALMVDADLDRLGQPPPAPDSAAARRGFTAALPRCDSSVTEP